VSEIVLKPVGIVLSDYQDTQNMPLGGTPAVIQVYPEYQEALQGIEENSHVWILAWFHKAPRDLLKTSPQKVNPNLPEYGVFALRAYGRPNPVAMCLAQLDRVEEGRLYVQGLDAIGGTPVIDIKPYYENDIVFSPETPYIMGKNREIRQKLMLRHALAHHGEECRDLRLAVRMAVIAEEHLGKVMAAELKVGAFGSRCLGDCIQGITRARLSNPPRFSFQQDKSLCRTIWAREEKVLTITLKAEYAESAIDSLSDGEAFDIELF
jgi:tRNA-Thr(GGU) m(6)t(6)A37 methyltransferase TsaA